MRENKVQFFTTVVDVCASSNFRILYLLFSAAGRYYRLWWVREYAMVVRLSIVGGLRLGRIWRALHISAVGLVSRDTGSLVNTVVIHAYCACPHGYYSWQILAGYSVARTVLLFLL